MFNKKKNKDVTDTQKKEDAKPKEKGNANQYEWVFNLLKACGQFLLKHPKVMIASIITTVVIIIAVVLFAVFAPVAFAATVAAVGGALGISSAAGTISLLAVMTVLANLLVSGLVIAANKLYKSAGQEETITKQDILSSLGGSIENNEAEADEDDELDESSEKLPEMDNNQPDSSDELSLSSLSTGDSEDEEPALALYAR